MSMHPHTPHATSHQRGSHTRTYSAQTHCTTSTASNSRCGGFVLGLMGSRPLAPATGAAVTARNCRQALRSEEK